MLESNNDHNASTIERLTPHEHGGLPMLPMNVNHQQPIGNVVVGGEQPEDEDQLP